MKRILVAFVAAALTICSASAQNNGWFLNGQIVCDQAGFVSTSEIVPMLNSKNLGVSFSGGYHFKRWFGIKAETSISEQFALRSANDRTDLPSGMFTGYLAATFDLQRRSDYVIFVSVGPVYKQAYTKYGTRPWLSDVSALNQLEKVNSVSLGAEIGCQLGIGDNWGILVTDRFDWDGYNSAYSTYTDALWGGFSAQVGVYWNL